MTDVSATKKKVGTVQCHLLRRRTGAAARQQARKCRIKYHPHNMSAVFVELPTGGHLRLPCADLGRPATTLWEQRAAPSAGIPRAMRAEPWPAAPAGCARRAAPMWTRRRCLPRSRRSETCLPRRTRTAKRPAAATARLPDRRSTVTEPRLCQPSRQWRFQAVLLRVRRPARCKMLASSPEASRELLVSVLMARGLTEPIEEA
jgi:hypothetical protein